MSALAVSPISCQGAFGVWTPAFFVGSGCCRRYRRNEGLESVGRMALHGHLLQGIPAPLLSRIHIHAFISAMNVPLSKIPQSEATCKVQECIKVLLPRNSTPQQYFPVSLLKDFFSPRLLYSQRFFFFKGIV